MKKVGIVTFHQAVNYGAILQAYALEKTIDKFGYNCYIIDYKNSYFKKIYGIQKNISSSNVLKKFILLSIKNIVFFIKKTNFYFFIKKNIKLSKKVTSNSIKSVEKDFDYFITGSDQVFNLKLTNNDYVYFLNFCDNSKKISYAASFGNMNLKSNDEMYKCLNTFRSISIREMDSIEKIKKNVHLEIVNTIDPTLLLNKVDWEKDFKLKCSKKNYIFFYKVMEPKRLYDIVENISQKNKLEVIEFNSNLKKSVSKSKIKRTSGPVDFISYIKNSEYVATTSFHATVFALIFHKKLILELKDVDGKENNRVINLLRTCGIDDFKIEEVNVLDKIDWEKVDKKLEIERENSLQWLMNALMGDTK